MAQKQIYFYDGQKVFDHSELVDADAKVPANATEVRPADGLYEPRTFNGTEWVGVSREEWLKNRPEQEPLEPSAQDKMIADLTKQLAKATQTATAAQSSVAELTKKVAELKGAEA